jgi:hypothetical protein
MNASDENEGWPMKTSRNLHMAENAIVSAGKWQVVLLMLRTTSTCTMCSAGDWRVKKKIYLFKKKKKHGNITLQER